MKPALTFLPILLFSLSNAYGQWTNAYLNESKAQLGGTAHGSKVYFGGGILSNGFSDLVEIYDPLTDTWETETLSQARSFPAAVTVGDKVMFAGGINYGTLTEYATVDIFEPLTQTWSVEQLSEPGFYVQAVSYQNTALFAGFYDLVSFSPLSFAFSKTVNIYDVTTGTWTTDTLSQARGNMSATVVGNLALFAGGQTSNSTTSARVDIYNFSTGTWSTASLSIARAFTAAVTVGNKALFAGGTTSLNVQSDVVDIYDSETGEWSTAQLSAPRSFTTRGAVACDKAFFAGGGSMNLPTFGFVTASDVVDIYDAATDTWSVDTLTRPVVNHVVVGVQNYVLIAGGAYFQPSTLDLTNLVDEYTCVSSDVSEGLKVQNADIQLFPNPASDYFQLLANADESEVFQVEIYDINGRLVKNHKMQDGNARISAAELGTGNYVVKIFNAHYNVVKRLTVSNGF